MCPTNAGLSPPLTLSYPSRGAEHLGVALKAQRSSDRRHRASSNINQANESDGQSDELDGPFDDDSQYSHHTVYGCYM